MNIQPQPDDAPEFVNLVENAVNGILHRYSPPTLVLIKIDNWFGSRWLGFRGKFIGAAGVTNNVNKRPLDDIAIPPFVPERVVSQRRFIAPHFDEVEAGESIQKHIPSRLALRRNAALAAPDNALIWYSGNSKANGRGSLMAYLPLDSTYWPWFVDLEKSDPWRITEIRGIKAGDFTRLVEQQAEATTLDR
jgi:hypothetical protein